MAIAAANVVTSNAHAGSGGVAHARGSDDDAFASLLGHAVKGNDKADVAANTVSDSNSTDQQSDASGTPTPDMLASLLHLLQPSGQAAANSPPQASNDTSLDGSSDTPDTADTSTKPGDTTPGKPAADCGAPTVDPALAQILAAQQAQLAQQTQPAQPATQTAATTDKPSLGTDIVQAAANGFDAATASSMLAGGATVKPAKPGATSGTPPASDEKSQTKDSAAAALAGIGDTVTRSFTDQKTSTAHALPLHIAADQAKNGNQPGSSSTGEQKQSGTPAQTAAPIADATPAKESFTPAPSAQPASLPASAAMAAHAATPAAPAASAATQVQLQSTTAAAQPDVASLAVTIAAKSEGGARHFDIQLNPAELGRVDVRLTVDDAGKAQATLTVEKPQTLELLQKDSAQLTSALKDAGLDLTQNGLNFSLKGQQQQTGGNSAPPRGRNHTMRAVVAVDQSASNLSLSGVGASDARLDIRV